MVDRKLALLIITGIIAGLTVAYVFYYAITPTVRVNTMANVEALDLDLRGYGSVEGVRARKFSFRSDNLNMSMGSSFDMNLNIGSNGFFQNSNYDLSGKLGLKLTNVSYFLSLSAITEDSLGTFQAEYSSGKPHLTVSTPLRIDLPNAPLVIDFNKSYVNTELFFTSGNHTLRIVADLSHGELEVTGDENLTLHEPGFVFIKMNLSVPVPSTSFLYFGMSWQQSSILPSDAPSIRFEEWQIALLDFMSNSECNVELNYASGVMAIDGRGEQISGDRIEINRLFGTVQITPTSEPNTQRITVSGDADSITFKGVGETERKREPSKSYLDYIWLFGFSFGSLTFAVIHYIRPSSLVLQGLASIILFFFCQEVWAIHTEQPLWLQNIIGFAALLVPIVLTLSRNTHADQKNAT